MSEKFEENIELPNGCSLTVENNELVCIDIKTNETTKVKGDKKKLRLSLLRIAEGIKDFKPIILHCFVCGAEIEAQKNRKEPTCSNKCRKQKQYMKQREEKEKQSTK